MHASPSLQDPAARLQLLDMVEILGPVTSDLHSLAEIPHCLVTLLPLDKVTFSLVERVTPGSDCLLISAGVDADEDPAGAAAGVAPSGAARPPLTFERDLDADHRLILNLHWGRRCPEISDDFSALLNDLCDFLVRSLRALLAWRRQPALLGEPFAGISAKQWRVLCQLSSDLIEKEIAQAMNIPPHTLHSYIKEIYRRLGVRSRMEAVRQLQQAVRRYRAQRWAAARRLPAPPARAEAFDPCLTTASRHEPHLPRFDLARNNLQLLLVGQS